MTHAMINGRLLPLEEARIPVLDRSFLYGDGIFETLRVLHGNPFRWDLHFGRLSAAAAFLGISIPGTSADLRAKAAELIGRNEAPDSVLRIHVSRGVGSRGYSPRDANDPMLVLTSHRAPTPCPAEPAEWAVILSPWRLPEGDVMGRFKTASRLLNVMARKAADEAGAEEALLLNSRGAVSCASAANLFWIEGDRLFTPPEQLGIRPGVTREVILELAHRAGKPVTEQDCSLDRLQRAEAVFLTQSAHGVVRVCSIDGSAIPGREPVTRWHSAYQQLIEEETVSL